MPDRLTINVFTPLPPERTSIADHSARLLPELARRADVVVWTYQEAWSNLPISDVKVRRFSPEVFDPDFHAAALNFYNLGNNTPFHGPIYEVSRRVPGVVIIHDANMGYFFLDTTRTEEGYRRYINLAAKRYGAAGVEALLDMIAGRADMLDTMVRYPMTEPAVEGALGVMVHNRSLIADFLAETDVPVYHLPLSHMVRHPHPQPRPAHEPPFHLVTFGYLGANRRLDSIAEALRTLPERDLFRWHIYGTIQVKRWALHLAKLRLGKLITTYDFVDEQVLDTALATADLAINLRNPTMGEASSSQLRIWEHGLPALVSRVGWYADQPSDTLFFVDPGDEVKGVQHYLREFLRDPDPFRQAGLRGRAYCDAVHNTGQYAQGMLEIATNASKLRARRSASDLAQSVIRHSASMLEDGLGSWRPGFSRHIASLTGQE